MYEIESRSAGLRLCLVLCLDPTGRAQFQIMGVETVVVSSG